MADRNGVHSIRPSAAERERERNGTVHNRNEPSRPIHLLRSLVGGFAMLIVFRLFFSVANCPAAVSLRMDSGAIGA